MVGFIEAFSIPKTQISVQVLSIIGSIRDARLMAGIPQHFSQS
jgi:hypothetical protein